MDTKFSTGIHVLIMISETNHELSSIDLANSVGTNPSYIRKICSLLKNAKLITRKDNKYGYVLNKSKSEISLYDIYLAVNKSSPVLFEVHKNSNDKCIVGKYIAPTLDVIFSSLTDEFILTLKNKYLSDCIDEMERIIKGNN